MDYYIRTAYINYSVSTVSAVYHMSAVPDHMSAVCDHMSAVPDHMFLNWPGTHKLVVMCHRPPILWYMVCPNLLAFIASSGSQRWHCKGVALL